MQIMKRKEKEKEKALASLKKFWAWLWHSNSIASWIVLFILAFLIVKFIFLPSLSLILNTKMPFVIVQKTSMQHCRSIGYSWAYHCNFDTYWNYFGSWYENKAINKSRFRQFPFSNGLDEGDLAVLKGKERYNVGDIIVFFSNNIPIIHRIVSINCYNNTNLTSSKRCIYSTKGDNNFDQLYLEKEIKEEQIIGKVIFVIPKIGWIKLIIFKIFNLS